MDTISLIAPLVVLPASEIGANAGATASLTPQSSDFEDLVSQLAAVTGNVAGDGDEKPAAQPEPSAGAKKPPGKNIAAVAADADRAGETALSVIAAVFIELSDNKKAPPAAPTPPGAAIEISPAAQISPLNSPSARQQSPIAPDGEEAAAPSVFEPAKLMRADRETASLPASFERPPPMTLETVKSGAPQISPLEAQIIPADMSDNIRRSPSIPPAFAVSGAPAPIHAADPKTAASTAAGPPPIPSAVAFANAPAPLPAADAKAIPIAPAGPHPVALERIDPGLPHPDRAFVVLSTKQARDGSFELRLDPPELGSVRISLSADDNGVIRALVTADRAETLDLVRRHIDVFRAEAGNHGLNNLDFRFESGSQSRNGPEAEKKKPAARLTDSFAAGFDGDAIFSASWSGGGMDVLA